jgi:hypothetical protein
MLYSCFDDKRALYRVYEDGRQHPVNADLPVPDLPRDAGRVGVAAIEAARCPGQSLGAVDGGLGDIWIKYGPVLLAGGTAMLIWWIYKR